MAKPIAQVIDLDSERGRYVLAALGYRRSDVVEVRVTTHTIAVDVIASHPSLGVRFVRTDLYDTRHDRGGD